MDVVAEGRGDESLSYGFLLLFSCQWTAVAPEACSGADGAEGSWGLWIGEDSPAAGESVGWDLQDAEAALAGLGVHLPAVVLFELALAGLVGAVLLLTLEQPGKLHQLVLECHQECVLERW